MGFPLRFRSILASIAIALVLVLTAQGGILAQSQITSSHGVQVSDMDPAVSPGDDFYRYANGGWLDRTQIPDGMPSYGTFEQLYIQTLNQQIELIQQMATTAEPGSDEWKAGQFFMQGIDIQTRNALGAEPIMPQMAADRFRHRPCRTASALRESAIRRHSGSVQHLSLARSG